jgi:hypothetical protein
VRHNSKVDSRQAKKIARIKYAERQIEKYIKWSIENRGKLLYNELVEVQKRYQLKCYG